MLISKEFYIKAAKLNETNFRKIIQISLEKLLQAVKIFISYKAAFVSDEKPQVYLALQLCGAK